LLAPLLPESRTKIFEYWKQSDFYIMA